MRKSYHYLVLFLWLIISLVGDSSAADQEASPVVKKDQRAQVLWTQDGEISAVDISDGARGSYHIQFITLEPNSIFLPVLLHSDMVFYVQTGSGKLSWTREEETKTITLKQGDVYRLEPGSVFFFESNLDQDRQKLRVHALFATSPDDLRLDSMIGAYSSIRDLVLGFDRSVLQAAFKLTDEVVQGLMYSIKPPGIVHGAPTKGPGPNSWELEAQFMKGVLRGKGYYGLFDANKKSSKTKTFNILSAKHDFENCNGWSLAVTNKELKALSDSNIGLFMVNLTNGSMMGPHWNPIATEITIVVQGQGMVRVVCSKESDCKRTSFRVEEGDVFVVPRFHPMAQMSFINDSLILVGFSTSAKSNHPQFLAGKRSVFGTLDKQVLAASFNVPNTTIDRLLAPQEESIILGCPLCAEMEEMRMKEEDEKEKEAARQKAEEEARQKEEESAREKEEARKKEEEEARKQEEEKQKAEEEAQKQKEAEEAWKREQEAQKQKEAEEAWKREQEAEKQKEAEEAWKKEQEAEKQREAEEAWKREHEHEAEQKKEAEEAWKRAQEAQKQKEAEEAWKREHEAEQQKEAEEAWKREHEAEQQKEAEEAWKREQEAQKQKEAEEAWKREQEAQRQKEAEEAQKQKEAEEAWKREQEAQKQKEAEEAWKREQEAQRQKEAEEAAEKTKEEQQAREEAAASEEERARKAEEERERQQGGGGGGGGGWKNEAKIQLKMLKV